MNRLKPKVVMIPEFTNEELKRMSKKTLDAQYKERYRLFRDCILGIANEQTAIGKHQIALALSDVAKDYRRFKDNLESNVPNKSLISAEAWKIIDLARPEYKPSKIRRIKHER